MAVQRIGMVKQMRRGLTDPVTIALITLLSTILTVVFDKETDGAITNFIYMETNATNSECLKSSKIMLK